MAATAAARVMEGGREVSNGARLVRRAIWFLLAAGACLPATAATARPAAPARQEDASTRDQPNQNRASNNRGGSQRNANGRRQDTPAPTPRGPRGNITPPPPPPPVDPDILKTPKLKIVITVDDGPLPRRMNVALWSRARDMPATRQALDNPTREGDAYIFNLAEGLHRKKDYWVTVTTADKKLSGEATVPRPADDNDKLPIRVALYPAVDFKVSTRREGDGPPGEGTLSVVEKSQEPSSSIPYALGSDGKASFVKGLNPEAEYVLVTGDGRRVRVNPDELKDGELRIDLSPPRPAEETVIKVLTEGEENRPVRDARVTVTFDDSGLNSKDTDEQGVAVFKAVARGVRAVEVEAPGHERYSCGRDDEDACPEPDESGARVITLKDASWLGWVGSILQSATSVVFVLAAAGIIVVGVAIFRILLNPTTTPAPPYMPPAGGAYAPAVTKATSGAATPAGAETSPQTAGAGAQESGAALAGHESTLTSASGDAAQPDRSPAAQAYSVPSSLPVETAKEAYKRWVRREKLTRDPVRLDLVFGNSPDDQSRLLKETNDPGSKFILFTDGENGGWLFPNPAPSVFQTEVEQTWRLVFKDLSKEEFGRKKERLNPVEARRADGAEGRGMWTTKPKPYEFG